MSIFSKLFDDINFSDVQELVSQGVQEKQNIEYKRQAYGKSDSDIKDMHKDVSSMANASGGYLFLGIKEDDDNAGIPEEIIGIGNAEQERDRILSSCISSIEPRIPGLKAQVISNEDCSLSVLAIFIPKSTRAPHMITFKGHNRFWIRHDRQISMMSVDEISQAFLRSSNLAENAERFLKQRIRTLKSKSRKPLLIIGATPLSIRDEIIDISDKHIRKLLSCPPNQTKNQHLKFDGRTPISTINGLRMEKKVAVNRKDDKPVFEIQKTLELFRNGYLESTVNIDYYSRNIATSDEYDWLLEYDTGIMRPILHTWALARFPLNFFRILALIREYIGLEQPFISYVSLLNIKDHGLPGIPYDDSSCRSWNEINLDIMPLQINDINCAPSYFTDRIWQAFGYDSCPKFDEEGDFKI